MLAISRSVITGFVASFAVTASVIWSCEWVLSLVLVHAEIYSSYCRILLFAGKTSWNNSSQKDMLGSWRFYRSCCMIVEPVMLSLSCARHWIKWHEGVGNAKNVVKELKIQQYSAFLELASEREPSSEDLAATRRGKSPEENWHPFSHLHHSSMSFISGRVKNRCSLLVQIVFRVEKFGFFFRKCRSLPECGGTQIGNWLRDVTSFENFRLFLSSLRILFPGFLSVVTNLVVSFSKQIDYIVLEIVKFSQHMWKCNLKISVNKINFNRRNSYTYIWNRTSSLQRFPTEN